MTIIIETRELQKHYNGAAAVKSLSLGIAEGEFLSLLGASGSGKTTTLRMIAGLEHPTGGQILCNGQDITRVPAANRNMRMVFQDFALFPNLTVWDNVAFGLVERTADRAAIRARVGAALELVRLAAYAHRRPSMLSGGQQQRVALARTIVIEPQVLLLDEPLSALDAKVRLQLRDEIRRIQLEVGTTTLFVTHDQEEALALADRVGVLRDGRLEQLATPEEVYRRPATAFVATFVGMSNRLPAQRHGNEVEVLGTRLPLVGGAPAGAGAVAGAGTAAASDGVAAVDGCGSTGGGTTALVRPEAVEVVPEPAGAALVLSASFLGPTSRVTVALPDDTLLVGRESAGVPDEVHASADARLVIPMRQGARSLNVALAAAMVLGEALRQCNLFPPAQGH